MNKIIAYLLLLGSASAKVVESYPGGPNFNIEYDLQKQVLKIDMYGVKRNSYIAVGLGSAMTDADMVLFSGTGNIFDMWSKDWESEAGRRPKSDSQQDW